MHLTISQILVWWNFWNWCFMLLCLVPLLYAWLVMLLRLRIFLGLIFTWEIDRVILIGLFWRFLDFLWLTWWCFLPFWFMMSFYWWCLLGWLLLRLLDLWCQYFYEILVDLKINFMQSNAKKNLKAGLLVVCLGISAYCAFEKIRNRETWDSIIKIDWNSKEEKLFWNSFGEFELFFNNLHDFLCVFLDNVLNFRWNSPF